MRVLDFEQYTPQWWAARRGMPTASEFHRIVTPAKWQMGSGAETYIFELIAQEFDVDYGIASDRATTAMRNGTFGEPEARRFYEFDTNMKVQQVGFCISDCGRFGCSPDGLVGDDRGLELKHPTAATQAKWLWAGVVPPEHLAQCHGGMIVTNRNRWDFLSYYPGMTPLLVPVFRDEKTELLAKALEEFHVMLTERRERIQGGGDPVAATREPAEQYF